MHLIYSPRRQRCRSPPSCHPCPCVLLKDSTFFFLFIKLSRTRRNYSISRLNAVLLISWNLYLFFKACLSVIYCNNLCVFYWLLMKFKVTRHRSLEILNFFLRDGDKKSQWKESTRKEKICYRSAHARHESSTFCQIVRTNNERQQSERDADWNCETIDSVETVPSDFCRKSSTAIVETENSVRVRL